MAGPIKELNKHRPTICKNCLNFSSRIDPYYKKTMCNYYDVPTDGDNDLKCSTYEELGDPI